MATTVLDELLIGLGYDYDPKELQEFKDGVDSATSIIKELSKVAVIAATALTGIAVTSTAATDAQGKLAEMIGLTVEEIDALQFANKISGDTLDGMSSSLRNLAKVSAEAARGTGAGIEAFGMLGISVTDTNGKMKPISKLLSEVSDRLQGFDSSRRIEIADKLGLSESLKLLNLGSEGIKELTERAKQLGVTTGEDAALAAEFQDSLTELFQVLKQVSRLITSSVAPALKSMVDGISNAWVNTRKLIKQNFEGWVDNLIKALKILSVAIGFIVGSKLLSFVAVAGTLFKAAAASVIKFVGALISIPVLIAGVVLAIGLLAQDAKAFFNGQGSMIGDLIGKYPQWESAIRSVATVFKVVSDLTDRVIDGWKIIFDLFSKIPFGSAVDFIKGVTNDIGGFFGGATDNDGGLIAGDATTRTNISNITGSPQSNNNRNVSIDSVSIEVSGAGDPNQVSSVIADQLEQALQDLDSPVEQ